MRHCFDKKVIICCGSGGVGKTTTAAAIALEASRRGKKTIVLTIDPARRLAAALGLESLMDEPTQVDKKLFAMMLDTKRTFDRLIEKYTPSPQRRQAILQNRLYQHMSNLIAGSQEYMAMERLYELYQEGDYDLLVLDTPPTRHALDFLEAPQKMINVTSNSLLQWFLKPGLWAGKIGLGALQKGADKILSVFDRLAGFSFLHELSEMLGLIAGLMGGFQDRARSVYELLRQESVGFILVTSPTSVAIQDSLYFLQRIREAQLNFAGFIINRSHAGFAGASFSPQELKGLAPGIIDKVRSNFENYRQLGERDKKGIQLLKKMGGKGPFYLTVPLLAEDVHDLEGLAEIGRYLL